MIMRAPAADALVFMPSVPDPHRQSGSRRIVNLIEFLRESGWQVRLASAKPGRAEDRHRLHRLGVPTFPEEELPKLVAECQPTLALFAFWHTAARHAALVRARSPETKIVVDSIDLQFVRATREAATTQSESGEPLDESVGAYFAGELSAYLAADAVLTVSEKEAATIEDLTDGRARAFCVPDCEDVGAFAAAETPPSERRGILFLGNFQHPPNRDAAEYLCERIVPRLSPGLLAEHPISIVGNGLTDETLATCVRTAGVRPVGWVPEVGPYLAAARVSVAPLRFGAGTKRKLIQGLMVGTPTVATRVAVEGLGLSHGHGVWVADEPDDLAGAISTLLGDDQAWNALVGGAREEVIAGHDRGRVCRRFAEVIELVLNGDGRPGPSAAGEPEHRVQAGPAVLRDPPPADSTAAAESSLAPDLDSMRERAPIFVIGSPRSGTSILTWSIGQHSNIFPVEESDWLAKLGINLTTAHALGSARGERSQLSAMGVTLQAFTEAFGAAAFDLVREHRAEYARRRDGTGPGDEFKIVRSPSDAKRRWVDGTPEYAQHVVALRQLFPQAKFIHLLRDAQSAALSMVNFHAIGGPRWDWNQAYRKWMAHVSSCVAAERTLGTQTIIRVAHADLLADPEAVLGRCLAFLGEAYEENCLKPLRTTINSSPVEDRAGAIATRCVDAELERAALELSEALLSESPHAIAFDPERAAALERDYLAKLTHLERLYTDRAGNAANRTLDVQPSPTAAAGPAQRSTPERAPAEVMKREWNERARANAMHFIASGREDWDEQEFFASGRENVDQHVHRDLGRICRGTDPMEMTVLEIGCGIGRMTRHLADIFGEVNGIDVAGEMIEKGKIKLADVPNAHLYEVGGSDLDPFTDGYFDFAFSFIVFQHIPYRDAIVSYFREVHRTLRPGCVFKFQVQGGKVARPTTWLGVGFTAPELAELAAEIGFEQLDASGEGTQYFWNWWLRR